MTSIQKLKTPFNSNEILKALEQDGAVILEDALNSNELAQIDFDSHDELAKVPNCKGYFYGFSTRRVGSMVGKSEVCQTMATNKTILEVMDHFLLPNCSDYQLNLSQLISIGPGEKQQIIHPDDPMFPFEHKSSMQVMLNAMWAIDDFTVENGATHLVPGSHTWPRDRHPTEGEVIQAEMKKGSCLIYLGSTRHGGGANKSERNRRGLVMSYSLGWLKQSENYFLSIPQAQAKKFSPKLQKLIGYFVHKPNLNMVDGRDPIELLQNSENISSKGFEDHIPEDVSAALKSYRDGQDIAIGEVKFSK